MIFVFLQFMPPEPKDFGVQLEVVLVCWVFLAIVLKLYPYLQRGKKQAKPTVQTLHTGLKQLSQMLTRIADGETDDDFSKELYKLEDTYHRMAYQMQTVFQKGDHGKKCFDMLAVMFQRSFYLVRDKAWQQDEVQQNALPRLTEVAELAEEASQTLSETDNTELIAKARTLLEQREMPEGRVRIFYRSCLHMLILICHTYPRHKEAESPVVRRGLAGNMAEIPAAHFPSFHRNSFCPPAFRGADHQLRRHGYLPRKPCILVPFECLFAAPA